jgi:ABC-type Na+ transport system ATPase subunit NatA
MIETNDLVKEYTASGSEPAGAAWRGLSIKAGEIYALLGRMAPAKRRCSILTTLLPPTHGQRGGLRVATKRRVRRRLGVTFRRCRRRPDRPPVLDFYGWTSVRTDRISTLAELLELKECRPQGNLPGGMKSSGAGARVIIGAIGRLDELTQGRSAEPGQYPRHIRRLQAMRASHC